jgi:hypothetical protein
VPVSALIVDENLGDPNNGADNYADNRESIRRPIQLVHRTDDAIRSLDHSFSCRDQVGGMAGDNIASIPCRIASY